MGIIFFDYDGVLVDSLSLCVNSCRFASEQLGCRGEFPENPYLNLDPVTYAEVAKRLNLDAAEFDRIATGYLNENLHATKLFDGTKEVLENLSKKYTLYVLSATRKETVKKSLEDKGVLGYFKEIYGGTEIPKKERLKEFRDKKAIMIGDSISDMEAAKSNGVYAIGALWGWQSKEMLKDADILVKNHSELLEAIESYYKGF